MKKKMMNKEILIANRKIGLSYPPYIIAEISGNHNGDINKAFEIISMAKKNGADAVKIQTYTADTLTIDSQKEDFQIHGGLWDGYNLYKLYDWAHTPFEWHEALFNHAKKVGITLFSTPFDETAVDLLESLNAPAYKIASFEAVDIPLIKYVAKTGKPMIISTGMANYNEIKEAEEAARSSGCNDLILLHCISSYPAPIDQSNLLTIPDIKNQFNAITGLSDHTLGTTVSIASIALGASVIEKHVTLDRGDKGPDSEFSLEPNELKILCSESYKVWQSLGEAGYERKSAEKDSIKFRRSIYAVEDIKIGDTFTDKNIKRIRPGYGLAPKYFSDIIGKKCIKKIERGDPLSFDYIESK